MFKYIILATVMIFDIIAWACMIYIITSVDFILGTIFIVIWFNREKKYGIWNRKTQKNFFKAMDEPWRIKIIDGEEYDEFQREFFK